MKTRTVPTGVLPEVSSIWDALLPWRRRFFWAFIYFSGVILLGATGYRLIERWSWFDCIYMAAVTASSVGFSEVHPLGNAGRAFTMVLMALSIVGLGIWWALITAFIIESDIVGAFRRRRLMKKIEQLSGHFIVCGLGRMGRAVVGEMAAAGVPTVAIELNAERVTMARESRPELPVIQDDATKEHTLRLAGLDRARGLAVCLPSDADNLFITLTARELAPELEIAVRVSDEESMIKLSRAGAQHIVSPNLTGAARMATMLMSPSVVSFLDAATLGSEIDLRLEDATIGAGSPLAGRTLAKASIPQRTGLVVIALRRMSEGGRLMFNPGPETVLMENDAMIVLGRRPQVDALREYARTGVIPTIPSSGGDG